MSGIIFLIILSFLVIIHEAGHFLFARWSKIKVEEFGLGYPPKAKTLFKDKLGTIYTLNWLPFGGFVRMFGEDGNETAKGSFSSVSVWKRLVVVLAGATINFIFGVLAFGAIYSQHGIPTNLDGVRVEEVASGSPAEKAGIKVGEIIDTVVSIDAEKIRTKTSEELISFVQKHRGEQVTLVTRNDIIYQTYVRKAEEVPQGQGSLGLTLTAVELRQYPWWQMPFRGMWIGLKAATNFSFLILDSLGKMVSELFLRGKVPVDISGPVGIVYTAEKEGFLREGFWTQLNFAAILSINLAIVNVLPFPALDGGRAVFLVWELLTRRRVKPKVEMWLNTAGFVLLLSLIVLISVRDITRVFADQGIQQWFSSLFR